MVRLIIILVLGLVIPVGCSILAWLVQRKFQLKNADQQRRVDDIVIKAINEAENQEDLQRLRRDVKEVFERNPQELKNVWPSDEFVQMNPYQSEFFKRRERKKGDNDE